MTEISTIYDGLVTRLAALLPNHKRLTDPYNLDNNSTTFLNQGWGLAVGQGENTERQVSCQSSVRRTFQVPITRHYAATAHAVTAKATVEKLLLEDLQIIYDDAQENGLNVANLTLAVTDDGITEVFAEESPYLSVTVIVSVEYLRNL